MILDALEDSMRTSLGKMTAPAVENEIRALGIKFPKARKAFAIKYNEYLELSRKYAAQEVTRPEANKVINDLLIPAMADHIDWAVNGDPKDAHPELLIPPASDDLNLGADLALSPDNTLLKFAGSKHDLEVQLARHHHVVSYAPVIPLCKPYLLREKLPAKGFKADQFSHYVVLERQLVIGISHEFLANKKSEYSNVAEAFKTLQSLGKEAAKLKPSSKTPLYDQSDSNIEKHIKYLATCAALKTQVLTTTAQMKSNDEATGIGVAVSKLKPQRNLDDCVKVEELAHALATILRRDMNTYEEVPTEDAMFETYMAAASKKLNKKLIRHGGIISYLGASWIWVMTAKEIAALQSCALGGHFSLVRWGFAFSDVHIG